MKMFRKTILMLLIVIMSLSMLSMLTYAQEHEAETKVSKKSLLTEPFDVTYKEEVDAGLYPYDESTVLVKLAKKADVFDVEGIAEIEYLFSAKDGFWYTASLKEGASPKTAIEAIRNSGKALLAEYNYIYETDATPLSDYEGISADVSGNGRSKDQWHLDSCGFQKAWKKLKNDKKNPGGDPGIVVAVIDTGVDYDHEDLKNNMWVNVGEIPGNGIDDDGNGYVDDYYGVNIVAKKGNGDDDHGHGTHVAGIIAAANNNIGVVGVAYNTKIMAIKAGQASGYFLQGDVCKAIDYARENGADVINMSFGGIASTIAVQDALEQAYTHSVLVAAAGNDGLHNEGMLAKPSYPAAYSFVLGVMSVDGFGVESSFTNYDVKSFNSIEYEVYAPGEAIVSTIPNNKYATWNGTSMAAPIVSGIAAVLRSVYSDPDMYPTKFIYGQIASTSERRAVCGYFHGHMSQLPQIVNLYDALTKLPKPEISVSDFKTFDTVDISSKNNGDGTIDSGETISLGFELRNRWGMSKDTIVTIDAISHGEVANPYVEFSSDGVNFYDTASINYGSVGTYSTRDCGRIIEEDVWTGWENPFYLRISKDAPNETILAINVMVESKNALDENDNTVYSLLEPVTINLIVKNGVVLPQIIDEDMTLTKDNYYIIQNTTIIEEGVTVTVTEGTNIQFWTNDSTDPYADSYIAQLVVKGTFNCVGTEEEPVKIFPSELMGDYAVSVYEENNGIINYRYTNITNMNTYIFNGGIKAYGFTLAENCVFDQNYKRPLFIRYISEGQVVSKEIAWNWQLLIKGKKAKNCAFYKLGIYKRGGNDLRKSISVSCENCIFVDSAIDFDSAYTYKNCVFLGNNNYWDSDGIGLTSYFGDFSKNIFNASTANKIARDEVSGKIYIETTGLTYDMAKKVAEYMGGTIACIETEAELDFLLSSGLNGGLGAEYRDGAYYWSTGEKIGNFITISNPNVAYEHLILSKGVIKRSSFSSPIIELDGDIYIEKLSFVKKSVTIDTTETYQLRPYIFPTLATDNNVRYVSGNTAVATVDEDGVIHPVDAGIAEIYVFSEDMQVSASMEIVVEREVKVVDLTAPEEIYIDCGNKRPLGAVAYPADTTKVIVYESSDESIVSVDENGNITALSQGIAVITV